MKELARCRVCNNPKTEQFFDLGEQPYANALLKNQEQADLRYPLSLSWCLECNLVQLDHTAEPEDLFSEYVWVTGTSKGAQEHAQAFYQGVVAHAKDLKSGYVLEAASNDGTFLKPFVQNGFTVLGVDPAKNIVAGAIEDGVPTHCAFFGTTAAEEVVQKHGKARLVFARNVLPHVADPHNFVEGMAHALDENGLMVLEVHYAKIIQEELHYDSIYHEHLCYFSLKSIEHLLHTYDLHVFDLEKSPISGGSLILYIKKGPQEESERVKEIRNAEEAAGTNTLEKWKAFAADSFAHRDKIVKIVKEQEAKGRVVGYGASARSSTLLNFCGIGADTLSAIADQNSLKHNHYTAGTHIPIESPEQVMNQEPVTVFILAWNFTDEIMDILRNKFKYTGTCIIPLPNKPRLVSLGD